MLVSAYAVTATICYLPAGIIGDRFRIRTLSVTGYLLTAVLTFIYAMMPSFGVLMAVFVGMGISTILIWWSTRFKLIRVISDAKAYARNIGISYGVYGAVGFIVGFINIQLLAMAGENVQLGVRAVLLLLAAVLAAMGIISWFAIPHFDGELGDDEGEGFSLHAVGAAFRHPAVWFAAATMFCVYFVYTGISYTAPYLSGVIGASPEVVNIISVIRTAGITLLAGPAFGILAGWLGKPSRLIIIASLMTGAGLLVLTLLPAGQSSVWTAALITIALGFLANGVYGIASSQLSEGGVGLEIFGTAAGLLSVIGFLPDTFSSTWFGYLIDRDGNAAFGEIFGWLIAASIAAAVIGFAFLRWVKKNGIRAAD